MSDLTPYNNEAPKKNLLFVTQLVYILHGLSIVIGLMTGATIISAFLFGWPSIAAVILNYIMAPDARGTFLQSHFSWQIRTFWYGMIWTVFGNLGGLPHCGGLVATAPVSTGILWLLKVFSIFK